MKWRFIKIFLLLIFCLNHWTSKAQSDSVFLVKNQDNWSLMVENKPFYIKGAGGYQHLDLLLESGGNCIRTWSTENAAKILDDAHKRGIKVMLGLWVQHERHGFDYNDEAAIKKQLDQFKKEIIKYKNHPALLLWAVGNEYDLQHKNKNVWKAVNDIAIMIQKEDPFHPVATVTAGVDADKLEYVKQLLTAIDIYGINTYGDIDEVHQILKKGQYYKPYMITEWGPTGHWESPQTEWKVSYEQTSAEKAAIYKKRYQQYIQAFPENCLGSFTFLWGQKQEYTSTWYGLFTVDGKATEIIDELSYCWSGKYPQNRAPKIKYCKIKGIPHLINVYLSPKQKYKLSTKAIDPEKDKINYNWSIYKESTDKKSGGDAEQKPELLFNCIKSNNKRRATLVAPKEKGHYRLFLSVNDGYKVAYLNIPFCVR